MAMGLHSSIGSNKLKSWLLLILFPLLLGVLIFGMFYRWNSGVVTTQEWNNIMTSQLSPTEKLNNSLQATGELFLIVGPLLIIRILISFFFQRQLMFSFAGARAVTRKEEPELYNLVENMCISRGLPIPKIGIIDEPGMNAFALWWRTKDAWVVFTKGLLNTLNKAEIEAVAAHELTHIINKDSLLMLIMVLYIGGITLLWEILVRTARGSGDSKGKNVLPLIGLALLLLGYLFYPLIRLAISRKREYLADAGSVLLTKDNQAMISALEKISKNPELPIKNKEMAAMFIANPLSKVSELFQTHPSVENRIKALQSY